MQKINQIPLNDYLELILIIMLNLNDFNETASKLLTEFFVYS